MNNDTTKVNETPVFSEPISADMPRRNFDRKLLEAYDADHERIRAMSSRLTRIEAVFDNFTRDMSRLEKQQAEILAHTEKTASSMALVANKFAVHAELEEHQWSVVNKANATLAEVGHSLSEHLEKAEATNVRMDWLEKMLWALWGVAGAAMALLVPLAIKSLNRG